MAGDYDEKALQWNAAHQRERAEAAEKQLQRCVVCGHTRADHTGPHDGCMCKVLGPVDMSKGLMQPKHVCGCSWFRTKDTL